ncbi:MAG: hypothetical protein M0O94_00285 [Bacteroidales bacterium]|nr:hypothetical protein [Bacteroidales bacterium]HPE86982.1 hypothetical protein [Bacteroidales bacterium]
MAPEAAQRTAFKKDRSTNTRTIMDCEPLYIENYSFLQTHTLVVVSMRNNKL